MQDTEYRLGDLRQSVQKIQGEAERLLERREQMGLQIRDLVAEETRLEEEIRALGERRVALAAEREDKDRGLEEARRRHAEQDGEVQRVEAQIEACRSALSERRERFETLRLEQIRVAGARAELTRSGASSESAAPRWIAAPSASPPSWRPPARRPTRSRARGCAWRRRASGPAPSSRC